MIVVDASAVVAALNREPGFDRVVECIRMDAEACITPISALEVVMVLARQHADPVREVQVFLARARIAIHPIDGEQTALAQQAFLTYGKGRHRARLNLSDCFSYAAAKALDARLLYVGNDFSQTDILAA